LGELFQGFVEAEPLDFLDELEDVAALATSEALVKLMVGVDTEGRGFFGVERAKARIALGRADALEADIFSDDADDVDGSFGLRREVQLLNHSARKKLSRTSS